MKKIIFDFFTGIFGFFFIAGMFFIIFFPFFMHFSLSDYDDVVIKDDFKLVSYFFIFFVIMMVVNLQVSSQFRFWVVTIFLWGFIYFVCNLSTIAFLSSRETCLDDGICSEGVYVWDKNGNKIEFSSENCHEGKWNEERKVCILYENS